MHIEGCFASHQPGAGTTKTTARPVLRRSRFYFSFCCFSFRDAPRVEGALTDIRHAGYDLFYGCAKSKAHGIACKKTMRFDVPSAGNGRGKVHRPRTRYSRFLAAFSAAARQSNYRNRPWEWCPDSGITCRKRSVAIAVCECKQD